jgi:hypothetical protein
MDAQSSGPYSPVVAPIKIRLGETRSTGLAAGAVRRAPVSLRQFGHSRGDLAELITSSVVGDCRPPAIPRRFTVQVLLNAEVIGSREVSIWTNI